MTIALGTLREGFAVLAADRLLCISDDKGKLIEQRDVPKIVYHPSLPLACTVAGLACLPADLNSTSPGWPLITDHINQVLANIDRNDFNYKTVAERIYSKVGPLIDKFRRGHGNTVTSHIALVNAGKADGAFVTIQEGTYSCANDLFGWTAPPETHSSVQSRLEELAKLSEPDRIAHMMADIVREACRVEGGKTVGLGIDTAIVSDKGVQLCQHRL